MQVAGRERQYVHQTRACTFTPLMDYSLYHTYLHIHQSLCYFIFLFYFFESGRVGTPQELFTSSCPTNNADMHRNQYTKSGGLYLGGMFDQGWPWTNDTRLENRPHLHSTLSKLFLAAESWRPTYVCTRVGTLIVATIYLQLIQNRYMFRSFTVLQCSHQHCVQPVALVTSTWLLRWRNHFVAFASELFQRFFRR